VAEGKNGQEGGPVSVGAFVLPNQEIENSTALTAFLTPIEAVERYQKKKTPSPSCFSLGFWMSGGNGGRASGLEFLKDLPVSRRTDLCKEVQCGIVVREFENRTQKRLPSPPPSRSG
jgi:endonuclease G, mitochondrial